MTMIKKVKRNYYLLKGNQFKLIRFFVSFALILLFLQASVFSIERRRDQFLKESGYLIIPTPYRYPGIGSGMLVVGAVSNVFESNTDIFLFAFDGDAKGTIFGINELYLLPETLYFDYFRLEMNKFGYSNYITRGMQTREDQFSIWVGDYFQRESIKMGLSFFERKLEFYGKKMNVGQRIVKVLDEDEETLVDIQSAKIDEISSSETGFIWDYTDDHQDPLKGIRLETKRFQSPRSDLDDPEFLVFSYNASLFIPIGENHTWVWNLFQSDAKVTSEGNTDYTSVKNSLGVTCSGTTAQVNECDASLQERTKNIINYNRNGQADPLGGHNRLRSYPAFRFLGGHTGFVGTELRFNLSRARTPFDIWLIKDVRTGVQLALFGERGSVSETSDELWKNQRSSYGAGIRFVMASGAVYKMEYALGDDGAFELILMFDFPWKMDSI